MGLLDDSLKSALGSQPSASRGQPSSLVEALIFEANRDRLKNPDLIHPGQKLRIPRARARGGPMLRDPRSILAALCLAAAACGPSEAPVAPAAAPPGAPPVAAAPPLAAFRVAAIQLGTSLGADKRISAPATTFAPTDTIYASVASEGAAESVTLTARWTFEDGQLVSESTQLLAPTGPAVTEFHVAKPSGWPAGRYRLEIAANGQPAASRDFEVR
jgi:hypothetical protein